MTRIKVPIVAVVGRANVGKSSFFNAALGRREAIVANEPGTTRDSLYGKVSVYDKDFWLVDTAGMKPAEDDFELTIQEQIIEATHAADVIIVAIEAHTTLTEEDRRVATLALKTKKPVLLAINKIDQVKDPRIEDYQKLGIKELFFTSCTQKLGIDELLEKVAEILPKATIKEAEDRLHIALLGRPNVGKSSLYNALAKKQQAIVADRAGTTRDINRVMVKFKEREIELLDTAGIRRNGKIERGIEKFSVLRSLKAIEEADICLLLVDANDTQVAFDQKIAGMISEAGKGLVLIVSKWDSLDKDAFTHDSLTPKLAYHFDFVPWAPLIVTSSITGQNVSKIFEIALEIDERRRSKFKTTELNRWLEKSIRKHPPAGLKNHQPKLRYMVQEDFFSVPSFKIFGSELKFLHWSYRRYLEKSFRETFGFEGTAIKFWYINQHEPREKKDGYNWKKRLRPDQIPNRKKAK